ncbi:MAG: amidohydrolase family protein [Desulfobacter sp.]|nr:amidohydrolase family protein [Desulfobacter sp.]WDP85966.1 MAG: amidohydrolase family protein [Desulfobacter sp.]
MIENNRIKSVLATKPKGKIKELGNGVIIPALVNAHVHLELSALETDLAFDQGFTAWVRQLLNKRDNLGENRLRQAANRAAKGLKALGTGIIGEISTLGITRDLVQKNGLSGIWFQECLGGAIPKDILPKAQDLIKNNLFFSMAGHAPHTCSPDLLGRLKTQTAAQGLVFSIHLAESCEESEFLDKGKGLWADFLLSRKIDIRNWPVGNTTPVGYLHKLGILDSATLGVHLLHLNAKDIDILADTGTQICLSPRSNENLHQRLPDIEKMLKKGLDPALGTDSLASCASLSLFDEMAFVRTHYPNIKPETIFNMATINGAKALGLDHKFGCLAPGKASCFVYLDMDVPNKNQLLERLTWNEI